MSAPKIAIKKKLNRKKKKNKPVAALSGFNQPSLQLQPPIPITEPSVEHSRPTTGPKSTETILFTKEILMNALNHTHEVAFLSNLNQPSDMLKSGNLGIYLGTLSLLLLSHYEVPVTKKNIREKAYKKYKLAQATLVRIFGTAEGCLGTYFILKLLKQYKGNTFYAIEIPVRNDKVAGEIILIIMGDPVKKIETIKDFFHPDNQHLQVFDLWNHKLYAASTFSISEYAKKNGCNEDLFDWMEFTYKDYKSFKKYYEEMKKTIAEFYQNSENSIIDKRGKIVYEIPLEENGYTINKELMEKTETYEEKHNSPIFKDGKIAKNTALYTRHGSNMPYAYCVTGKEALSYLVLVQESLYKQFDKLYAKKNELDLLVTNTSNSQESLQDILNQQAEIKKTLIKQEQIRNSLFRLMAFFVSKINLDCRWVLMESSMPKPLAQFMYARSIFMLKGEYQKLAVEQLKEAYLTTGSLKSPMLARFVEANIESFKSFEKWGLSKPTQPVPEEPQVLFSIVSQSNTLKKDLPTTAQALESKTTVEQSKSLPDFQNANSLVQPCQYILNSKDEILLHIPCGKPNRKRKTESDPKWVKQNAQKGRENSFYYCLKIHAMMQPHYLERQSSPDRKAASNFRREIHRKDVQDNYLLGQIISILHKEEIKPLLKKYQHNKKCIIDLIKEAAKIIEPNLDPKQLQEAEVKSFQEYVNNFLTAYEASTETDPVQYWQKIYRTDRRLATTEKFLTDLSLKPKDEFNRFIKTNANVLNLMSPNAYLNLYQNLMSPQRITIAQFIERKKLSELFNMNSLEWTPWSHGLPDLIKLLKQGNPIVSFGMFDPEYCPSEPTPGKNIGDYTTLDWSFSEVFEFSVKFPLNNIVIIGASIKDCVKGVKEPGCIYWLNVQESSDPNQHKQRVVNRMSYKAFVSRCANEFGMIGNSANFERNMSAQKILGFDRDIQNLKSSTQGKRSIKKYGYLLG